MSATSPLSGGRSEVTADCRPTPDSSVNQVPIVAVPQTLGSNFFRKSFATSVSGSNPTVLSPTVQVVLPPITTTPTCAVDEDEPRIASSLSSSSSSYTVKVPTTGNDITSGEGTSSGDGKKTMEPAASTRINTIGTSEAMLLTPSTTSSVSKGVLTPTQHHCSSAKPEAAPPLHVTSIASNLASRLQKATRRNEKGATLSQQQKVSTPISTMAPSVATTGVESASQIPEWDGGRSHHDKSHEHQRLCSHSMHRSPVERPCQTHSFHTDAAEVHRMEKELLCLLDDFNSGKLRAFGQGSSMQQMERIRDQQESLAKLHFDLGAKQGVYAPLSEEGVQAANENMDRLMTRLESLSLAIGQLNLAENKTPMNVSMMPDEEVPLSFSATAVSDLTQQEGK